MAQTLETISRLTIIAEEQGMAGLARTFDNVHKAVSDVVRVTEQWSAAERKASSSIMRGFDAALNKITPFKRETEALARELQKLEVGQVTLGIAGTAEANQQMRDLVASTRMWREEAARAAQAEEERQAIIARNREMVQAANPPVSHVDAYREEQAAIARVDAELAKRARQAQETAQAVERLAMETDEGGAAAKRYAAAIERAGQALKAGDVNTYRAAVEKARREFEAAGLQAAKGVAPTATQILGGGSNPQAGAARESAEAFREAAEEAEVFARKANELEARLAPVAHATALAKKEQELYDKMLAAGAINSDRHSRASADLAASLERVKRNHGMDELSKATKLSANEMTNLSFQINDVISGLVMGQAPLTVIAQQGGQFYQIFADKPGGVGGALRTVGSQLMKLVTPARLAVGAIAGGAVLAASAWNRFDDSQRSIAVALSGTGRAAGLTARDINRVAQEAAAGADLSVASTRELATALANTGRIGVESMQGILGIAKRYALTTGQEMVDANKELAAAFADPAQGAETLGDKLGILDAKTRATIATMAAQGDRLGAQKILFDAMSPALVKTAEATGFFAREWDLFIRQAKNADDAIGGFIDNALRGATALEELADAQKRVDNLLRQSGSRMTGPDAERRLPSARAEASTAFHAAWRAEENRQMDPLIAELQRVSVAARNAAKQAFPELDTVTRLTEEIRNYNAALADPAGQKNVREIEAALARATDQAANLKMRMNDPVRLETPDEGRERDFQEQLAVLRAVTVEERAAAEAVIARTAALRDQTGVLNPLNEAQRAQEMSLARANQETINATRQSAIQREGINAEISAMRYEGETRDRMTDRIRAENELRQQGKNTTDANAQAYIREAEAMGIANRARERAMLAQETQRSLEAQRRSTGDQYAEAAARGQMQGDGFVSPVEEGRLAQMREAARLREMNNELALKGLQISDDTVNAMVQEAGALAKMNAEMQAQSQARSMLQGQKDQIALLELETRTIGMNGEERAVLMARMQAEHEVRGLVAAGLASEAAAYVNNAEKIARATAQRNAAVASAQRSSGGGGGGGSGGSGMGYDSDLGRAMTDSAFGSMKGYSAPFNTPPNTEIAEMGWILGRGQTIRIRETAEHMARRMQAAADAAKQIKANIEDAAKEKMSSDFGLYGNLFSKQIDDLRRQRDNIADNDNNSVRDTPYLDPYSFKNATRFYNPGPGGHFAQNEGRVESAISAASNAQMAALDAQIAQLEQQQASFDRLQMLSEAGVKLTAQEVAELQGIQSAIRAGAGAQDLSDFQRMQAAADARLVKALSEAIQAARAGVPVAPRTGDYEQVMQAHAQGLRSSGILSAIGAPKTSLADYGISGTGYHTAQTTGGNYGMIRGYANGGEFTVPGTPGVDKPYIMGLAGNEHVQITPAAANSNHSPKARGRPFAINQEIHVPPGHDVRRSAGQAMREARRGARRIGW